jgi:hypothetical protein
VHGHGNWPSISRIPVLLLDELDGSRATHRRPHALGENEVLRSKGSKPGTPAHDDLVRRDFTADTPNEPWVADITEHPTAEGKLHLCAIKDLYSNRIVGWAIDSRMKARSSPHRRHMPPDPTCPDLTDGLAVG